MGGHRMLVGEVKDLEREVAQVIVEVCGLDMPAENIDPEIPLFHDGLALDSIDLLEIALAITSKYGFQLRSDDPDNERIFGTLRTLSAHIALNRTR